MAFSLSGWFKGKPGSPDSESDQGSTPAGEIPAPALPPPPPPAPSAVRTVLPSSAAPVSLLRPPSGPSPANAKPPVTRNVPMRPPVRKVSFPVPVSAAPAAPMTPVVPPSVARKPIAPPAPPAPAPVLEAPDVTVSLEVGDFIDRIPPGFLQEGSFDRSRVVVFRASELYSDLARGKASVPLSTIYAKCPEVFARPVTDTEDAEISLPLQKLVEQMSAAFTTRTDQVAEENVGEIETPFLQVANEDNARLPHAAGTSAGAIRPASDLPFAPPTEATASNGIPQRPAHRTGTISTISAKPAVEPPAAPTFTPPSAPINPGKRPPSTVRASVAGGKIRLSGAAAVTRIVPGPSVPPIANPSGSTAPRPSIPAPPSAPSTASPSHQVTKKTARIQIPPISLRANGVGAAPRPGSIPPPPSVPVQPSPVSIRPPTEAISPVSFRSSPPVSRTPSQPFTPPPSFAPPRPTFPPPAFPAVPPANGGTPPPPAPAVLPPSPSALSDDRKIELGLAAVLRGQPSSALAVEPSDVPDDVRLTLPFASIEKQLSTGRVLIPRQVFEDALPEAHHRVLADDSTVTEVQIPLQEVFQNLPGNALSIRHDQVVEEMADLYPTPFKQKADEDAERLGTVAPVAPVSAAAEVTPEPVAETFAPFVEDAAPAGVMEDTASAEPEIAEESFASIFEEGPIVAPASVEEPFAPVEEPIFAETAPEEPLIAPVADVHPAAPAVEPPAAVEPPPVEEALAVLESTAPGEEMIAAVAPVEAPAPAPMESPVSAKAPAPSVAVAQDTELQTLFMTEDDLDAKGIVRLVCQLPGVTGCAVMFADGLRLAGNFPDGDAEGFSAMAPPFFKRTGNFAQEAVLGGLNAVTLYTDKALISFFMHDDICLGVRHTGRGFQPGVREKLIIVTRELARMYSSEKPSAPHDYAL